MQLLHHITDTRIISLADTRITQQELGACKPVLTKAVVTLVFLVVALIFIPIGVVCYIYGYTVSID